MENKEKHIVSYEEESVQHLINILNTFPISGYVQVKSMNTVFDILANPLPEASAEKKPEVKTQKENDTLTKKDLKNVLDMAKGGRY
jgi:hypothetical protein